MKENIFHMNVKIFSRKKGHNFFQKLAYRDGGKYYDDRTGKTFDYERRQHDVLTEFSTPEHATEELKDRDNYYQTLHKKENRKDSQLFREIEISLFRGLSKEENIELAKRFCKKFNDEEKLITDMNFHKLNEDNPHCHILLPLRPLDENGELGLKIQQQSYEARKDLLKWRKRWEDTANEYFKEIGHDAFISSASNKSRGINRPTQKHLPINKKSKKYEETKQYNNLLRRNKFMENLDLEKVAAKIERNRKLKEEEKKLYSDFNFKRNIKSKKQRKSTKQSKDKIYLDSAALHELTKSQKKNRNNGFSL